MKVRLLRGLGIAAALAMPIAGFAALGSGTAGAISNGTHKTTWTFHFHTSNGTNTVHCGTVTLDFTSNQNTTSGQWLCSVKAGGSTQGIGTATTIHLLTGAGSVLITSSSVASLKSGFNIKLKFGTTTCTVSFKTTIALSGRSTAYTSATTHTKTKVTVSPSTAPCSTITALLQGTAATFKAHLAA